MGASWWCALDVGAVGCPCHRVPAVESHCRLRSGGQASPGSGGWVKLAVLCPWWDTLGRVRSIAAGRLLWETWVLGLFMGGGQSNPETEYLLKGDFRKKLLD